jgi:hypothetical protein
LPNDEHFGLLLHPLERAFALLVALKNEEEINNYIDFIFNNKELAKHQNGFPIKAVIIDMICSRWKKSQNNILVQVEALFAQQEKSNKDGHYLIILSRVIMTIYKGKKDKDNIEKWAIKYAEKCCDHLTEVYNEALKCLDNAIAELSEINFEWTNKLRLKKQDLQKRLYNRMNFQTVKIPLDANIAKLVKSQMEMVNSTLEKLDGVRQFDFLMRNFRETPIAEVEKQLKENE